MSESTQPSAGGQRGRVALAIVLIVIGIGGLVGQAVGPNETLGGWMVLLIGLGMLGAFAYTRLYGCLIPGAIMTGLGRRDRSAAGAHVGHHATCLLPREVRAQRDERRPPPPGGGPTSG